MFKRARVLVLVSFCFLLALALPSFATRISLVTTVNTKIADNTLLVLVSAVNKGDESAFAVQAEIDFHGEKILLDKKTELSVDQTYQAAAKVPLGKIASGQYPLVVVMHYADANQYPFSVLTAKTFNFQSPELPADLIGKFIGSTFWEKGGVDLVLKNLSDEQFKVQVSLAAPREITVDSGEKNFALAARQEQKIHFELKNFSALSGSTYQVFGVVSYQKGGRQQALLVPGTVSIQQTISIMGINSTWLIIILVVLCGVFILFQIIKQ